MDDSRPIHVNGVWIASLATGFLCETCRHRIPHWRGGATCAVDPLRLTVTRACRAYEAWSSDGDQAIHEAFWAACDDLVATMPCDGRATPGSPLLR